MDSRRISAAVGFTLLIACIVGVVILIYNSGTSRRSPFQNPFSSSSTPTTNRIGDHPHHPHIISSWNGGKKKDGFTNDPNYHPEQPTMQDVNELADELHRFLSSSKSKHVHGKPSKVNGSTTMLTKPIMKNGMPLLFPVNHNSSSSSNSHKQSPPSSSPSPSSSSSHFQSATSPGSPKKASISVINYSSLPNGKSNNHRQQEKRPYRGPPAVGKQQTEFHHSQHQAYPGQENIEHADDVSLPGGILSERGGLQPNDLYTTSWLPSMIPPGSISGSVPLGHSPSPSSSSSLASSSGGNVRNHLQYQHQQPLQYQTQNRNSPSSSRNRNNNGDDHDHDHDFSTNKGKVVNGSTGSNRNIYNGKQEMIQQQNHRYDHDHNQAGRKGSLNHAAPDKGDGENEEEDEYEYEEEEEEEDDPSEKERLVSGGFQTKGNTNSHDQISHDVNMNNDDEEEEEDDDQEDDVDPEPKNFAADLETLFELANHLYTSGIANLSSSSLSSAPPVLQTFLKTIKDKIQKSNESRILKELNEIYKRPSTSTPGNITTSLINSTSMNTGPSSSSSLRTGADFSNNSYEKSLTAFIFMSFGIFLLNQIHSFVQDSGASLNASASTGRGYFEPTGYFDWFLDPSDTNVPTFIKKESSLDILFDPPEEKIENNEMAEEGGKEFSTQTSRVHAPLSQVDFSTTESPFLRNTDHGDSRASSGGPYDIIFSTLSSSSHVNNMFRAMLNVANAYTRDDTALECIWSMYCKDLDATAGERGLYGVAARINSVGLRLIMNQIPPSLTMDVILRSLVGWDGLPCRKMFPDCAVGNGTISVLNSTAGVHTSHNDLL